LNRPLNADSPPLAVVFDMDGLLLDSERLCREIFAVVVEEKGLTFDADLYGRCIGTTHAGTREILEHGYGAALEYPALEREWMGRYHDRVMNEPVALKPGALELLEALGVREIQLALATSTESRVAERKLDLAGLDSFFEVKVTGDQVARGKPHPEPYLEALRRLSVPAQGTWALEDSDNGVLSAHAAGLRVFQIPDLQPPADRVRELGHPILESLHELVGLL
jgi:HAD superfamily hydrolase (TIGR01509 family)